MNMAPSHKYDDIIGLSRPVSWVKRPMSAEERAAQFSPFAALTGFEAVIDETARYTDSRGELSEDEKALLNEKLLLLQDALPESPEARFEVFRPDERKEGGEYVTVTGRLKRIDPLTRCLLLQGGEAIAIDDIYSIELLINPPATASAAE